MAVIAGQKREAVLALKAGNPSNTMTRGPNPRVTNKKARLTLIRNEIRHGPSAQMA